MAREAVFQQEPGQPKAPEGFSQNGRGMSFTKAAPVFRESHPPIDVNTCAKQFLVTNRAKKGCLKGKDAHLTYAGFSEIIAPDESVRVDREIIFGIFENPFTKVDDSGRKINIEPFQKQKVTLRFGDYQYASSPPPSQGGKRMAEAEIMAINGMPLGPPKLFPDLTIQQIDSRGNVHGEKVAVYDVFYGGQFPEHEGQELITATK